MKATKIGKQFEKDTQDILDLFKTKYPLSYIRLYDTTSARGKYLPEQPADFIVGVGGCSHLIENKASEKHDSLRSCLSDNVSTQQALAHRMWARTGQPCWFLFLSHKAQRVDVWEGLVVGEHRAKGRALPKGGQVAQFPMSGFQEGLWKLFGLEEEV